jgi:hypothetical protein
MVVSAHGAFRRESSKLPSLTYTNQYKYNLGVGTQHCYFGTTTPPPSKVPPFSGIYGSATDDGY